MTYARNLVEGHGIVFYPGGERVEGFTSPLWMFVLSIFAFVKLSLPAAAFYGGSLFGAGTIILTSLIYRRVFQDQNQSLLLPSLAALAESCWWRMPPFPRSSQGWILHLLLLPAAMIYALADEWQPYNLSVPADALPDPSGPAYAIPVSFIIPYIVPRQRVKSLLLYFILPFIYSALPLSLFRLFSKPSTPSMISRLDSPAAPVCLHTTFFQPRPRVSSLCSGWHWKSRTCATSACSSGSSCLPRLSSHTGGRDHFALHRFWCPYCPLLAIGTTADSNG